MSHSTIEVLEIQENKGYNIHSCEKKEGCSQISCRQPQTDSGKVAKGGESDFGKYGVGHRPENERSIYHGIY